MDNKKQQINQSITHTHTHTELLKYYAQLQTAVPRDLKLPGRLAGCNTGAAPKHLLLFQFSFRVIGHAQDVHLQSGDVSTY